MRLLTSYNVKCPLCFMVMYANVPFFWSPHWKSGSQECIADFLDQMLSNTIDPKESLGRGGAWRWCPKAEVG